MSDLNKWHNKYIVDYHMHTTLSDGVSGHYPYVLQAQRIGLSEIGFSDHICLKDVPWSTSISDLPGVVETITALKRTAPIPIKFGIEMDYIPGSEKKIELIIESLPVDYVIGSVHFIKEWNFDSPKCITQYQDWDCDELYSHYFRLVQLSAQSELFDILGHIDLIKKFGHRADSKLESLFRTTAEIIKKHDLCIEINTSGLTKPCREMYPSKELVETCFQYGIPVTLGSDAHKPENVGQYFAEALQILDQIGYDQIACFDKRNRSFTDISVG